MDNQSDNDKYYAPFNALFADLKEQEEFWDKRPLLAHYTTIQNLENILKHNEIWLSNPLFMNDFEELRFGIVEGVDVFLNASSIKDAFKDAQRYEVFSRALRQYLTHFEENEVMDTYVFCLSEHDPNEMDGKLSMWRGYGENGNGAAIVFDTSSMEEQRNSPFALAKVQYGSREERTEWLQNLAEQFATIVANTDAPDDKVYLSSYAVFKRLQLFALFSKHSGFIEEQEWRVVYLVDRDVEKRLVAFRHYHIGSRGVEPKLRFKFEPVPNVTSDDFSLDKILDSIILGPTTSTPLARLSVERMLELMDMPQFKELVIPSTIPYRER